jgi:outer membrane protein TolC
MIPRLPLFFLLIPVLAAGPSARATPDDPLLLDAVLASVKGRYPPWLAALIEQDIMNGRARQALGAFDTSLSASGSFHPTGYYNGTSGYVALEQPLSFWGGGLYSGYRFSSGFLADYDKNRTEQDGQAMVGFRLPLLRDGTLDKRRADLFKARIDQELADPLILRLHLDFIRTASVAYYNWVAAGYRVQLTAQLLEIARNRQTAITEMVSRGAQAPIVQIDNERLVISRELALVSARRLVEAHSIELSLFYRDTSDQPIRPADARLPAKFPPVSGPASDQLPNDIAKALMLRPEIRRVELNIEKNAIDQRLAKNNLLPNLDLSLEANQAVGDQNQKDIDQTEIQARIDLKVPLQRREAKGRLAVAEGQFTQLIRERQFTRDQVTAAVQDAYSALQAARDQIEKTGRNVDLAEQLEKAENARFTQGAADLLALQIREQATFDARLIQLQAQADFFRALANYRAAIAADAPTSLARTLPSP